jgi:hypothetical protein
LTNSFPKLPSRPHLSEEIDDPKKGSDNRQRHRLAAG